MIIKTKQNIDFYVNYIELYSKRRLNGSLETDFFLTR